ncbi:MAG: hypothetical protein E6G00_10990 [Actinobacteria bacterium]|nr:MAG: hypothetical protein E6G29_06860 [Actinomycetota bacterium]TMM09141.1 MAG: hypothetical protein E6G00_10990 [Actinomycetota bacterium]
MARRIYKLEHFAKGTGATVVPNEEKERPGPTDDGVNTVRVPRERRRAAGTPQRSSTPLPPGHVRKKSTGEIGRVVSVDARAGTAVVSWLREGRTTTVPLTAISRR